MRPSLPFAPTTILDAKVDLHWYWEVLFRHARLILGMAGICLSLALFVVFLIVPQYTASTQILLEPRKQNLLGPEAITEFVSSGDVVEAQIAIIRSRALLTRVVEDEQLALEPGFGAEPPPSLRPTVEAAENSPKGIPEPPASAKPHPAFPS